MFVSQMLVNLLDKSLLMSMFKMDMEKMQQYWDIYDQLLEKNLPRLHAHLTEMGISPNQYRNHTSNPHYNPISRVRSLTDPSRRVTERFCVTSASHISLTDSFVFSVMDWFFTVFSRTVPLELSSMLWDHFLSEQPRSLHQSSIFCSICTIFYSTYHPLTHRDNT